MIMVLLEAFAEAVSDRGKEKRGAGDPDFCGSSGAFLYVAQQLHHGVRMALEIWMCYQLLLWGMLGDCMLTGRIRRLDCQTSANFGT